MILIAAIIAVVALASAAIFFIIPAPDGERIGTPMARQIQLIADLADRQSKTAGCGELSAMGVLQDQISGEMDERLTGLLHARLAKKVSSPDVIITRQPPEMQLTASIRTADCGFLVLPLSEFRSAADVRWVFTGWMLLIILGVSPIALFVANRMTAPLAMLERAIASVKADGLLPDLPEQGPPEVRATARALKRLSARLKVAMESRMRLVAAAGHDLRTPMTRMRLRAEFLGDDERAAWISDLNELARIADSAIGLVREETESLTAEPLALDRLICSIAGELTALDFKVTLATLDDARISGAQLALARAFRNLLINAATHGGGAMVSLEARDGQATVIIDDNGPGIPEELLERAFEPFFRVDSARRQPVPGAGLGLAIAKEIIDRQTGSIVITNRQGGGLRQTVSFNLLRENIPDHDTFP